MGFSRGHKLATLFFILGLVYVYLIFIQPDKLPSDFYQLVKCIPGYLIMILGCHALLSIGTELAILKDFPQENESLQKEVQEAKQFYKKHNIILE